MVSRGLKISRLEKHGWESDWDVTIFRQTRFILFLLFYTFNSYCIYELVKQCHYAESAV